MLLEGVCAMPVNAEAVERWHPVGGKIGVAAATGRAVLESEPEFGGEPLGVLKETRDAGILLVGWPIEPTGDSHLDVAIVRLECAQAADHFLTGRDGRHPQ